MVMRNSWILFCCLLLAVATAPAQTQEKTDASALATERARIEASENLSEAQKKADLATLAEAGQALEKSQQTEAQILELRQLIDSIPDTLHDLATGKGARVAPLPRGLKKWSAAQLDAKQQAIQLKLQQAQDKLADWEQQLTDYTSAARSGGGSLSEIRKQLDDITQQLESDANGAELSSVKRLALQARREQLQNRLQWLKLRQDNLAPLTELAQAQRDHYADRVQQLQARIEAVRTLRQNKRQAQLQSAVKQASDAVKTFSSPVLQALQEQTARLVAEQSRLIHDESAVEHQLQEARFILGDLERDHERIQHIVNIAGDQQQASALLQKRRALAPSTADIGHDLQQQRDQLNQAVLRQLELDEQLRAQGSQQKQVEALLKQLPAGLREDKPIRARVQTAVQNNRQALLDLLTGYTRYMGKLSSLEGVTRQLQRASEDYRLFINDHLLWMPSAGVTALLHPEYLASGVKWLLSGDNLHQLREDLGKAMVQALPWSLLLLLAVVGLLALRTRALASLQRVAQNTAKVSTDSFTGSLLALLDTLVLALPLPLLFLGLGWLLQLGFSDHVYTQAIAAGLLNMGKMALLFGGVRHLCRADGLALRHLRWQPELCAALYHELSWSLPLLIPSFFIVSATAARIDDQNLMTLGRLAFVFMLVILLVVIFRIWNRNSEFSRSQRSRKRPSRWAQYHFIWFYLLLAKPLILIAMTLYGYYYTATYLAQMIEYTLWFILGMLLLKDMLLRKLRVMQRRMRLREAIERRREQFERMRQMDAGERDTDTEEIELDDEIDFGELSEQVKHVVRISYGIGLIIGCWFIWKETFPALTVLNSIELPISTHVMVDGVSTEVPVTAGEVFFGVLIGILTFLAAKNLPSILELTLLQRLPLTRSSRYAITTLVQYVVAIVGIMLTFSALGLEWSSIQWLVAALSVGLGFGLQEIVANFVSGIILLFEQPIRVGDVVTVNNVTGKVSRMRIRATTILDWNRQELIIPNKNFITGELINWTLSDTINRLVITVGVAYGSDTRRAMLLLRQQAVNNPRVLDDPAPRVSFEEFADSALILRLRVYLDDVDQRLASLTELHQAINDCFEKEGISIAFPQQDLHLDTQQPLELVLRDNQSVAAKTEQ